MEPHKTNTEYIIIIIDTDRNNSTTTVSRLRMQQRLFFHTTTRLNFLVRLRGQVPILLLLLLLLLVVVVPQDFLPPVVDAWWTSSHHEVDCFRPRSLGRIVSTTTRGSPDRVIFSRRRRTTTSGLSAVSSFQEDNNNDHAQEVQPPVRLSRPQRKALERQRKQSSFSPKKRKKSTTNQALEQVLVLLSSPNNNTTTPVVYSLLRSAIRHAHKVASASQLEQIYKLLNLHVRYETNYDSSNNNNNHTSPAELWSRFMVAALDTPDADPAWWGINNSSQPPPFPFSPLARLALVRAHLRRDQFSSACQMVQPMMMMVAESVPDDDDSSYQALLDCAAYAFAHNMTQTAVELCQQFQKQKSSLENHHHRRPSIPLNWNKLLKAASQCEAQRRRCAYDTTSLPCNVVYAVLQAMTTTRHPCRMTASTYELLTNALMRRIVFVKGVVRMEDCPADNDIGEVLFWGRSNVGKSSLINAVTNRLNEAYVSQRPGKTQQFNYFAVNDKVGLEKEIKYGDRVWGAADRDCFRIVDAPGYGYAQGVSAAQRQEWMNLTLDMIEHRSSLRVVFHLVSGNEDDGGGVWTEEDAQVQEEIQRRLKNREQAARYVLVRTKIDKSRRSSSYDKKEGDVIYTSAVTKEGVEYIWKYMQLAAEG